MVILLTVVVFAANPFIKTVAVIGGSARQLSAVLANANYNANGSTGYLDLELCNPSDAAGTLYVGSNSNVSSTAGTKLVQNQCKEFPTPGDAAKIYIWTNANQNMEVWMNAR